MAKTLQPAQCGCVPSARQPPCRLSSPSSFSFLEVLGITRRQLLALLSMPVAIEPLPAKKRVLKSRAVLDKQIADMQSWTARVVELKGLIQESSQVIEGLSARVMKLRRDPDNILG